MDPKTRTADGDFQEELQELLAAARGMAEGKFHQVVNVKARGAIGELAAYMNQTIRNLQHLDPTVKGSSRQIPQVAQQLAEVIRTTEDATNRVLEEAEQLMEEGAKVEAGITRTAENLRHSLNPQQHQECVRTLEEIKEVHRRSQGRYMDVMAAMEFQDVTTQKINKLITLVAEVESRLLQILILFRLEDTAAGAGGDPVLASCAQDGAALENQDLVDQLLREFQAGRA